MAGEGGERGIRTPGTLPYNGFQDHRIRPLCHLSKILSGKRDSNPRPSAWKADALSTELFPQELFFKD